MKNSLHSPERFVTDAQGKRVAVVLDLAHYERLRQAEAELAEIRAYDRARPRIERELAADQVSTLRAYRARRARKAA